MLKLPYEYVHSIEDVKNLFKDRSSDPRQDLTRYMEIFAVLVFMDHPDFSTKEMPTSAIYLTDIWHEMLKRIFFDYLTMRRILNQVFPELTIGEIAEQDLANHVVEAIEDLKKIYQSIEQEEDQLFTNFLEGEVNE